MNESLKELKKLAERVDKETAAMHAIAEFCNDGVWDWHLEEDYEYMSPRFWEILGYDYRKREHHPKEWQSIIHPDDKKRAMDLFYVHAESKGKKPYVLSVKYAHPKDGWTNILCRGKIIEWDEDEKPVRMIGTHTLLD